MRPLYAKKNIKEGRKFAIFSLILFQHHFFRHYYYHFIGPADICKCEYSNLRFTYHSFVYFTLRTYQISC